MISTDPAVERWQTCRREPTCSARSTSRAMIDSSATAGQPARPSSADTAPSFICAPSVRRGSWACCAMTPSNAFTYSSARRMISGSHTQKPRSEEHTSELQSRLHLVCRLLLEKKNDLECEEMHTKNEHDSCPGLAHCSDDR